MCFVRCQQVSGLLPRTSKLKIRSKPFSHNNLPMKYAAGFSSPVPVWSIATWGNCPPPWINASARRFPSRKKSFQKRVETWERVVSKCKYSIVWRRSEILTSSHPMYVTDHLLFGRIRLQRRRQLNDLVAVCSYHQRAQSTDYGSGNRRTAWRVRLVVGMDDSHDMGEFFSPNFSFFLTLVGSKPIQVFGFFQNTIVGILVGDLFANITRWKNRAQCRIISGRIPPEF